MITPQTDAMSDVLGLVRMRAEMLCGTEYSIPWSLEFRRPAAHFHILLSGGAFLCLDDAAPLPLGAGDLALLPLGAGHVLTSDPALPTTSAENVITSHRPGSGNRFTAGGGGARTDMVCGRFSFAGVLAPKLLTVLPAVIHIPSHDGEPTPWLRLTSQFLIDENRNPRPGSAIMITRLLELLFIQAVRAWAADAPHRLGWLSGLKDAAIGRTLTAIHQSPANPWTVEALADIAGLSRSAFAARFTDVVGQPPLKYLATWRLDLAADHLRAGTARLDQIATAVGYGSEAALTRAFKAQFGTTPAAFRRGGPR